MLPGQPLRFVLDDDPGAGKTIMARLYIRELVMRADARRILIVALGRLVEQWRDGVVGVLDLQAAGLPASASGSSKTPTGHTVRIRPVDPVRVRPGGHRPTPDPTIR
jgi:hypothetical protein